MAEVPEVPMEENVGGEEGPPGLEDGPKKKYGPPGLTDAITEALQPHAHLLKEQSLEEFTESIQRLIVKGGKRGANDERTQQRGSSAEAQAVIDDFVAGTLTAMTNANYDNKEWLAEVDWTSAFVAQAKYTFGGTKLVVRTLQPALRKFIEDAIFRHKEEERITKVFEEALTLTGLSETYVKRAQKNLDYSYNEAHMAAPYGSTGAATPELGLVQDFVKHWMTEFAARSWDILEQGVEGVPEDRYHFMTNLFTYMCDPNRSLLPQDVVSQLEAPPPENWPFIQEQAMASLKELEENPHKRRKYPASKGW